MDAVLEMLLNPDPASEPSRAAVEALTPALVAAYLRLHPDFLVTYDGLAAVVTPKAFHRDDGVVDLQAFLLHRVREELATLRLQQQSLIVASRTALSRRQRVHAAILAILAAQSLDHLLQTITVDLAVLLDVDVVTLCIEGTDPVPLAGPGILQVPPGTIDAVLGVGRDALLEDQVRGDPELFGDAAGLVNSEAIIRLSLPAGGPPGVIAMGSRRSAKFKGGQGTDLLCFLGRALGIVLGRWLNAE